jgi:hypothetical protein
MLPFYDNFTKTQGFIPGSHCGVDYAVGASGAGERIVAGAAGTVKTCPYDQNGAGYYTVMDHGTGHRTRYLHLSAYAVSNGQIVGRGGLIGYEGSTGYTDPPGFNHLHFETRHGATQFTYGKAIPADGTPVDPYSGSTYMWLTTPPSFAQKINDFNCDGFSDTLSFNASGQAIVGLNNAPTPTFQPLAGLEIPSTGDFDGDGRTDTFARRSDGQAIIGLNQGSSFSLHNWGTVGAWGEIPIVAQYDSNSYADTQSFQHPPTGCSHAIVALGSGGSGFQGLGDWGTVGCSPEIPAGFQAFAYEKRWDRWFAAR